MATRRRDVIVIGGSAGSIEALLRLFRDIPPDLDAAIAVVTHRHPTFASSLAKLLTRRSNLEVVEPVDSEPFTPRRIYLAPADRHMTICDGHIQLSRSAKQHHTRPAIDPLFVSAAEEYGPRVVGALLTGNLSDGVSGLIRIKEKAGLSMVQDPNEAPFPSMPRNALIYDHVDLVFQIGFLANLLAELVKGVPVQTAVHALGARPTREADYVLPRWLAHGHRLP
jgi:two-component system, chemotaxis family, protein-glutamate methylesterase/glutaminase